MHLCCPALCKVRAAMTRVHSSLNTPACCCLTMSCSMYASRARTLGSANVNSKAFSSVLNSSYEVYLLGTLPARRRGSDDRTRVLRTLFRTLVLSPREAPRRASYQTRTSNMIPGARHASWKALGMLPGKHPRNVPISPPPHAGS
jgi:hypothetical protein